MGNPAPLVIPGEDRAFGGPSLYVDLVPAGSWAQNARALLSASQWKTLSVHVKDRCGRVCEICGTPEAIARRTYIEAHERWHYDDANHIQSLRRLIGLCSPCHRATHLGFAVSIGAGPSAYRQLCRVNNWTLPYAQKHAAEAFSLWRNRSHAPWSVDMTVLEAWRAPTFSPPAVSSPCIKLCRIEGGVCAGCRRTLDEIAAWPKMTEVQRRHVMEDILPTR